MVSASQLEPGNTITATRCIRPPLPPPPPPGRSLRARGSPGAGRTSPPPPPLPPPGDRAASRGASREPRRERHSIHPPARRDAPGALANLVGPRLAVGDHDRPRNLDLFALTLLVQES